MMDIIVGYSLFSFFVAVLIVLSAILWLLKGLAIAIYWGEDHTSDADWRPLAIGIFVVCAVAQWFLLSHANIILPNMWHSLPPISG